MEKSQVFLKLKVLSNDWSFYLGFLGFSPGFSGFLGFCAQFDTIAMPIIAIIVTIMQSRALRDRDIALKKISLNFH